MNRSYRPRLGRPPAAVLALAARLSRTAPPISIGPMRACCQGVRERVQLRRLSDGGRRSVEISSAEVPGHQGRAT